MNQIVERLNWKFFIVSRINVEYYIGKEDPVLLISIPTSDLAGHYKLLVEELLPKLMVILELKRKFLSIITL